MIWKWRFLINFFKQFNEYPKNYIKYHFGGSRDKLSSYGWLDFQLLKHTCISFCFEKHNKAKGNGNSYCGVKGGDKLSIEGTPNWLIK